MWQPCVLPLPSLPLGSPWVNSHPRTLCGETKLGYTTRTAKRRRGMGGNECMNGNGTGVGVSPWPGHLWAGPSLDLDRAAWCSLVRRGGMVPGLSLKGRVLVSYLRFGLQLPLHMLRERTQGKVGVSGRPQDRLTRTPQGTVLGEH